MPFTFKIFAAEEIRWPITKRKCISLSEVPEMQLLFSCFSLLCQQLQIMRNLPRALTHSDTMLELVRATGEKGCACLATTRAKKALSSPLWLTLRLCPRRK